MVVHSNGLTSQKNVGNWWGAIKQLAGQLGIYITIINMFLIAATAWNTTLSNWLERMGVMIPFWVFMLAIVMILAIAMWVEYKVSLASYFSFWNDQFYRHDNPLRKDIEDIKRRLDELQKR